MCLIRIFLFNLYNELLDTYVFIFLMETSFFINKTKETKAQGTRELY